MSFTALLIANRGEIAIRIARAAADLGLRTVAVYSEDDVACLHTRIVDEAHALPGMGARAYLDGDAMVAAAKATGCGAPRHDIPDFIARNSVILPQERHLENRAGGSPPSNNPRSA